jgi:hypothetical protein
MLLRILPGSPFEQRPHKCQNLLELEAFDPWRQCSLFLLVRLRKIPKTRRKVKGLNFVKNFLKDLIAMGGLTDKAQNKLKPHTNGSCDLPHFINFGY